MTTTTTASVPVASADVPRGRYYYCAAFASAGGKFDNHVPFSGRWAGDLFLRPEEDTLRQVVLAEKSSGSMIRLTAISRGGRAVLVAGTKNGTEQIYLATFERVLLAQLGPRTAAGLACFLAQTRWTLACELVARAIGERPCAHGSTPATDHLIVHGGTKGDQTPVTPVDLLQMRATLLAQGFEQVVDALWFPRLIGLVVAGVEDATAKVDRAIAAINNAAVWPSRTDTGSEYVLWTHLLPQTAGAPWWVAEDHATEQVDHPSIFEGFVAHNVWERHLRNPASSWGLLRTCVNPETGLFAPERVPPLPGIDLASSSTATAVELLQGFGAGAHLTLQDVLEGGYLAEDETLVRRFLWELVRFAESRHGVACGVSKTRSFMCVLAHNSDGDAMLTVSLRGDTAEWSAYARYYHERLLHGEEEEEETFVRFSRGMSFLLTAERSHAMASSSCLLASREARLQRAPLMVENREKHKLANYTLRTMLLRPWMTGGVAAAGFDVEALFKAALGQMRRWRVTEPAARREVLLQVYRVAAYMVAFGKGASVAASSYLDVLETALPSALERIGGSAYPDLEGASLDANAVVAHLLALHGEALFSVAIAALADEGGRCAYFRRLARTIEWGFGVKPEEEPPQREKGFIYRSLADARRADALKRVLLPVAALLRRFGRAWIEAHSARPLPLHLVFVAATPGAGKSAHLEACAQKLRCEGRTVVVAASDRLPSGQKRTLGDLLDTVALEDAAYGAFVLVDRCAVSNLDGRALWHAFPRHALHVHVLVPEQHAFAALVGNDGDWCFPFSLEHMAVCASAALVRRGHPARVEGEHGFEVALAHAAGARLPVGRTLADVAWDAFGTLADSFSWAPYAPLLPHADLPPLPSTLRDAVRLELGFQLSREMRDLATADEGGRRQLALSDDAMLSLLSGSLTRNGAASPLSWAEWLESPEVVELAARYHVAARRSVADVAAQMHAALLADYQYGTWRHVDAPRHERTTLPVIPAYFAAEPIDPDTAMQRVRTVPPAVAIRSYDLHVTLHRPGFAAAMTLDEEEALRVFIQRALAPCDTNLVDVQAIAYIASPTMHALRVRVDGDDQHHRHMTLLCAAPNKEARRLLLLSGGDTATTVRPLDPPLSLPSQVIARVPLLMRQPYGTRR